MLREEGGRRRTGGDGLSSSATGRLDRRRHVVMRFVTAANANRRGKLATLASLSLFSHPSVSCMYSSSSLSSSRSLPRAFLSITGNRGNERPMPQCRVALRCAPLPPLFLHRARQYPLYPGRTRKRRSVARRDFPLASRSDLYNCFESRSGAARIGTCSN